ncbi:hypothetical protein O7626_21680 [Micromonospora sp. WMMD1102]|uniref:hypothetical protein n=1 Tax=Micromonospora sp. WMMD1102 TaxID=3016105 RepID=UPI002414FF5D|nr:hypothetical protein [Micromonospora sp. WMMD1102]MDG4788515.1 hypothetical protein [Micromonospora sp. WMMD1102]
MNSRINRWRSGHARRLAALGLAVTAAIGAGAFASNAAASDLSGTTGTGAVAATPTPSAPPLQCGVWTTVTLTKVSGPARQAPSLLLAGCVQHVGDQVWYGIRWRARDSYDSYIGVINLTYKARPYDCYGYALPFMPHGQSIGTSQLSGDDLPWPTAMDAHGVQATTWFSTVQVRDASGTVWKGSKPTVYSPCVEA